MALIKDNYDPSGYGMFSKVGRFTSEKYAIIRRKDELITPKASNSKANISIPAYDPLDDAQNFDNDGNSLQEDPNEQASTPNENKSSKRTTYTDGFKFSKSAQRGGYSEVQKTKNMGPPIGYYNPKRVQAHQKTFVYRDPTESLTKPKNDADESNSPVNRSRSHLRRQMATTSGAGNSQSFNQNSSKVKGRARIQSENYRIGKSGANLIKTSGQRACNPFGSLMKSGKGDSVRKSPPKDGQDQTATGQERSEAKSPLEKKSTPSSLTGADGDKVDLGAAEGPGSDVFDRFDQSYYDFSTHGLGSKKVKGFIEFDLIQERPININMTHDPFGLSFIKRELPKNCSRVKRKPIVDMNKNLGRNPAKRKKPPISQADYRPNYFFGKTNPSSRVGPLLETLKPRKPDYYRS